MNLRIKLVSMLSAFVLILSMLLIGVWAVGTQTINIKGSVSFNISDSSLYVKDIRLQNSLIGEEDIDFLPGYVNQSFTFNLGEIESSLGTIKLEIDVVNTTETLYQASTSTTIPNVEIEVEGIINGDNIEVSQAPSYTGVSGTIIVTITFTGATQENITLDNIVINLDEFNGVTVTFIGGDIVWAESISYLGVMANEEEVGGFYVFYEGDEYIINNVFTIEVCWKDDGWFNFISPRFVGAPIKGTEKMELIFSTGETYTIGYSQEYSRTTGIINLTKDVVITVNFSQ